MDEAESWCQCWPTGTWSCVLGSLAVGPRGPRLGVRPLVGGAEAQEVVVFLLVFWMIELYKLVFSSRAVHRNNIP